MNLRSLFTATVLAAALPALPALAAPTCNAPQVVSGNNCVLSAVLGWGIAGLGTASVITFYIPPSASGPVDVEITGLNSNLGSNYTGFFGFMGHETRKSPDGVVHTFADIGPGGSNAPGLLPPGAMVQFVVTQICWDPTCTAAAPSRAVANMFSLQFTLSSPNTADLNLNSIQMAAQFLSGSQVAFQEQEPAVHTNSLFSIIPGINLGATPQGRYQYNNNGLAVTQPYDVLSISNFANPNPITGTATLQDQDGNTVATATIPAIPPNGAAGFLVIGRNPGDPLALFPSTLVLPAGADGLFHGNLIVGMNGLTATGLNVVLAQEFNGYSMLNLFVFHSPVP